MANKSPIYQFKITLKGIRPPIWRRFQVKSAITFRQLHEIIQTVMGWYNYHLYNFDVGFENFTDTETAAELGSKNATRHKIDRYIRHEGEKALYEYDFGDSWEHELLLEKIVPAEPGVHYPRCLKGKRNCPPEDCGGPWGYANMLEALADPNHPEFEMYQEWLGDEFDPEEFSLEDINEMLQ
jgi:hypothetical protein